MRISGLERRAVTVVVVLALAAAHGAGAADPVPEVRASKEALGGLIDGYLQPFLDRGDLSGNLLVARGDEVVYERSFGMANHELDVSVKPDTRFNIASVTKPMTVIGLIQLAAQGKLSLDDPLAKWIPDFPRGDEITVGHLARHRAGIPHRVTEPWEESVPRTAAQMVELAKARPLTAKPGEGYNYSSGGFSVLARVLELAGGRPYGELLQEFVFGPAGMTRSLHTDARTVVDGRAAGYVPGPAGAVLNAPLQDLSFLIGAGSVFSTARDLHALVRAVRTGKFGPGAQQSFIDDNGLDWNGVTGGYRAFADWHRASDTTVVFVGNLQTGAGNRVRRDVPRIAAGEQVAPPVLPRIEVVVVPDDTLRRWEGIYELRPGSPLRVQLDAGMLRVNEWILVPVGERRFFSPQDYAFVEVILDDTGRPLRLDWVTDDATHPCPRVGDL